VKTIAHRGSGEGGPSICFVQAGLTGLVRGGCVDSYVVSTEDGFSPLGRDRLTISRELGVPEEEIKQLAAWNHFENRRVTAIAISSRWPRDGVPGLRGVILAPAESSECYRQFAEPYFGKPYRDFYYNVTYESLFFATSRWGSRLPALSHLSASGRFHRDVAACNIEALDHLCDSRPGTVGSLTFLGCCIDESHVRSGIETVDAEKGTSVHRPITVQAEQNGQITLLHLQW
jgi:hypothetical protein